MAQILRNLNWEDGKFQTQSFAKRTSLERHIFPITKLWIIILPSNFFQCFFIHIKNLLRILQKLLVFYITNILHAYKEGNQNLLSSVVYRLQLIITDTGAPYLFSAIAFSQLIILLNFTFLPVVFDECLIFLHAVYFFLNIISPTYNVPQQECDSLSP